MQYFQDYFFFLLSNNAWCIIQSTCIIAYVKVNLLLKENLLQSMPDFEQSDFKAEFQKWLLSIYTDSIEEYRIWIKSGIKIYMGYLSRINKCLAYNLILWRFFIF